MKSTVLLMDEPFIGLDAVTRERLHSLTLELWEEEKPATLFVTHDIDEAIRIATRLVVLGRTDENRSIRLDIPNEIKKEERFRANSGYAAFHSKILEALR
jgi:sulfonate transport system ATP-binding protein